MPRLSSAFVACALAGCAHDLVLPSQTNSADASTCGDGVTSGGEACDVASPGCVDCQVQPGWTCNGSTCTHLCDAAPGDGAACVATSRGAACDLTGFWAVRETTYLRDAVFASIQVSSNWYLFEVVQTGDYFSLEASLDCGVHVTGSATIDYPPATERALVWANPEDGTDATRGRRSGTSMRSDSGCAITLSPWYFVRGVDTSYLPASFSADPALSTLPPLPSVEDPIDGGAFPDGATDPTMPGIPGVGTVVSGLAPGVRYAAQRSTTTFATSSAVSASSLTVVVPGTFDVQENVLRVTSCGDACALLTTVATPATDLPPHATWQFLGTTLASPGVTSVVVAEPRVDIDLDLETCANVVALLPHDGTVPTPDAGGAP